MLAAFSYVYLQRQNCVVGEDVEKLKQRLSLLDYLRQQHWTARPEEFTLRDLQANLGVILPGELERILKTSDQQSASKCLESLVIAGYYAQLFDSWEDARSQLEEVAHDPARAALSQMFDNLNSLSPRRRVGE